MCKTQPKSRQLTPQTKKVLQVRCPTFHSSCKKTPQNSPDNGHQSHSHTHWGCCCMPPTSPVCCCVPTHDHECIDVLRFCCRSCWFRAAGSNVTSVLVNGLHLGMKVTAETDSNALCSLVDLFVDCYSFVADQPFPHLLYTCCRMQLLNPSFVPRHVTTHRTTTPGEGLTTVR